MAVASGLSTTFALETLIQWPPPGFSLPASFVKVFGRRPSRRFRNGTILIQRRFTPVMIPRYEAGPDLAVSSAGSARASSLSAHELFKTSAADRYTKERSSIVVLGLSVHNCPVEMREKLAIPEAEWPRAIEELCKLNHIEEAAVLSTCNRMEIYVVALSQHRGVKEVTEWMFKSSLQCSKKGK